MKGFALIELLIVVAIVCIFGLIVYGASKGQSNGNTVTWGINGMTEVRCIDGLKFVIGQGGQARQVYDQFGKGVPCGQNTVE